MHVTHAKLWEVVADVHDSAMAARWESTSKTDLRLQTFVLTEIDALCCWHTRSDLEAIAKNHNNLKTIPEVVARMLGESYTAKAMLQSHWLECSQALFSIKTAEFLQRVEADDFKSETIALIEKEVEGLEPSLAKDGHVRGRHAWTCKVALFGAEVEVPLEGVEDEFDIRLWARLLTVQANNGQIDLLPFERLVMWHGRLDSVPSALQLPDEHIESQAMLRRNIDFHLQGGPHTMNAMVDIMKRHSMELARLHKSFPILLAWLKQRAQADLSELVGHLYFMKPSPHCFLFWFLWVTLF